MSPKEIRKIKKPKQKERMQWLGFLVAWTQRKKGPQIMHISIENQKVEKQKDQTLKEKQNQICRDCGITADRMMCRVALSDCGKTGTAISKTSYGESSQIVPDTKRWAQASWNTVQDNYSSNLHLDISFSKYKDRKLWYQNIKKSGKITLPIE